MATGQLVFNNANVSREPYTGSNFMPEIGLDGPGIDAIVRQLLRKLAAGLSRFEPERSRRAAR